MLTNFRWQRWREFTKLIQQILFFHVLSSIQLSENSLLDNLRMLEKLSFNLLKNFVFLLFDAFIYSLDFF